ncbi:MAG: tautomerase family protein, partial [Deltaproteobacteria bacterium]|nr:tautomerase family protein [Deltaproteobacteria bacterium]
MPLVKVSILRGRSLAEKKAVLEAVHSALVDAFKIPEMDRNQRLLEYDPDSFEIPPGKSDNYVLVELTVFPGRSKEAKRRLYQFIVRNLVGLDIDPNDVFIVLYEPPLENWGIRGGIPATEIDFGFN